MAHYPVFQPDGLWSIYSTIVDAFTVMDASAEQALEELASWHRIPDEAKEREHLNRIAAGAQPEYASWHGWDYCAAWIIYFHGYTNEQATYIKQRTPPDRMAAIMANVERYRAEAQECPIE